MQFQLDMILIIVFQINSDLTFNKAAARTAVAEITKKATRSTTPRTTTTNTITTTTTAALQRFKLGKCSMF